MVITQTAHLPPTHTHTHTHTHMLSTLGPQNPQNPNPPTHLHERHTFHAHPIPHTWVLQPHTPHEHPHLFSHWLVSHPTPSPHTPPNHPHQLPEGRRESWPRPDEMTALVSLAKKPEKSRRKAEPGRKRKKDLWLQGQLWASASRPFPVHIPVQGQAGPARRAPGGEMPGKVAPDTRAQGPPLPKGRLASGRPQALSAIS